MATTAEQRRSNEAEINIAEAAFREAIAGGDHIRDAYTYALLMAESARLARG